MMNHTVWIIQRNFTFQDDFYLAPVVTVAVGGDLDTIANIFYDLSKNIPVIITTVREENSIFEYSNSNNIGKRKSMRFLHSVAAVYKTLRLSIE